MPIIFNDDFIKGFHVGYLQNNKNISKNSDWYEWTHNDDIRKMNYIKDGYPEDNKIQYLSNDLLQEINKNHLNTIKIDMDWASLFPDGTENIDADIKMNDKNDTIGISLNDKLFNELKKSADNNIIEKYHDFIERAKSYNIKIILTLYNGVLPLWLHDPVQTNKSPFKNKRSGWINKNIVNEFAKYAYYISRTINNADFYITINNGNDVINKGYMYGNLDGYPPGISSYDASIISLRNMAYSHNIAYKILSKIGKTGISISYNNYIPYDDDSIKIADYTNYIMNKLILFNSIYGLFDNDLSNIFDEKRINEFYGTDFIEIDYSGNVYTKYTGQDILPLPLRFTFMPCRVCSDNNDVEPMMEMALYDVYKSFKFNIIAGEKVPGSDNKRAEFVKRSLIDIYRSMKFIKITGNIYSTLYDGYEFSDGFARRCGMIDIKNNKKDSFYLYASILNDGIND